MDTFRKRSCSPVSYTHLDLEGKNLAVQSTTKPEGIFLNRTDERIPKLGNLISLAHWELIYTFLGKGYVDAVAAHEESIVQYMGDYNTCLLYTSIWIVELAESHTVIGRAGLQLRDGYEEPELGFVIAPAYRGHGYAREACEAVLQVAREELFFETIRAVVHRDNEKSLRLCKKLGFIVDNKAGKDENPWIFLKKSLK